MSHNTLCRAVFCGVLAFFMFYVARRGVPAIVTMTAGTLFMALGPAIAVEDRHPCLPTQSEVSTRSILSELVITGVAIYGMIWGVGHAAVSVLR